MTAPVKLVYRSNSANIAFYRIVGDDFRYISVLRHDDLNYRAHNRPKRPVQFNFIIHLHTPRKWTESRFTYSPKTKPAPGNLPLRTVTKLVREWFKDGVADTVIIANERERKR